MSDGAWIHPERFLQLDQQPGERLLRSFAEQLTPSASGQKLMSD
jgi:hypothetical protein